MPGLAPQITAWQQLNSGLPAFSGPSSLTPVTFPTAHLKTIAYIALGADPTANPATWAWTDITAYVRYADAIGVRVGKQDEAGFVTPGQAQLRLDNRDGRFSRRNPTSPYYGLLTRNTPIWLMVNPGPASYTRFQGFVNEWPTRWDKSGNDTTVPIVAGGVLRRLGQGTSPAKSPLLAGIPQTSPTAYWPLEGFSPASALTGGATMSQRLQVNYATQTGQPGSGPLPDFAGGGSVWARLPNTTTTNNWRIECVARFGTGSDTVDDADFTIPLRVLSPNGQVNIWELLISGGTAIVQWSDTSGGFTGLLDSTVPVDDGEWHHFRINVSQSGADILVAFTIDGISAGTSTLSTKTLNVTDSTVYINGDNEKATYVGSVGHLAYWAPWAGTLDTAYAASGYAGEEAQTRMARLCDEAGVSFTTTGSNSPTMGPQPVAPLLDLLRECEAVDGGVLYELGFGLGYQGRDQRENVAAILTLDFDLAQVAEPPEPADDDQRTRNLWAASRPGGALAIVEETDGPLGSDSVGVYDDSVTVNVEDDDGLSDQAGWRVHIGTWDEDRWPRIDINLTRSSELISTWATLPFGARVNVRNPPSQVAPDAIDAFIEGYTEAWNAHEWRASLNTTPAKLYDVGILANTTGDSDPTLGWLEWDTCTLASAAGTSDVTWTVTVDPQSTTSTDDFPRGHWSEGELVTATAAASSVTDTFTRVTANGWGTSDSGLAWSTSGGAASDYSTSGTEGSHSLGSVNTPRSTFLPTSYQDVDMLIGKLVVGGGIIPTGNSIYAGLMARRVDASNFYLARLVLTTSDTVRVEICKVVAGTLTILATSANVARGTASGTAYAARFQVLGTTLRAKAWDRTAGTAVQPTDWLISTTDSTLTAAGTFGCWSNLETGNSNALPVTFAWDDFELISPQTWTVTRSVNGVSKSHAAGAEISLQHPVVLTL